MSVFHKMYLGSGVEFDELKKVCLNYSLRKNVKVTITDSEINISSECFTIFVKSGGNSVLFRSEDYGLDLKYDFYIDINSAQVNWEKELILFVGIILRFNNDDFVLEANSDFPYIMRRKSDGIVIVDDTKLGCYPFDLLGIEYEISELLQI